MSKTIEKLEKDLAILKETNRSLWNTYGSELCVADMISKEKELEKKILKIKTIEQRKNLVKNPQ